MTATDDTRRTRDSQRSKVYTAERVLDATAVTMTPDELKAYTFKAHAWLTKYAARHGFKVRPLHHVEWRAGRGGARAYARYISYNGTTKSWVALHEVAHFVIEWSYPGYEQDRDLGGHGWVFCDAYLKLVRHFLGVDAHNALKAAFKDTGCGSGRSEPGYSPTSNGPPPRTGSSPPERTGRRATNTRGRGTPTVADRRVGGDPRQLRRTDEPSRGRVDPYHDRRAPQDPGLDVVAALVEDPRQRRRDQPDDRRDHLDGRRDGRGCMMHPTTTRTRSVRRRGRSRCRPGRAAVVGTDGFEPSTITL